MSAHDDRRNYVLFASAFRYDAAPNIAHVTLDGVRTLCGRTGWATEEGWQDDVQPDCKRCDRALAALDGGSK